MLEHVVLQKWVSWIQSNVELHVNVRIQVDIIRIDVVLNYMLEFDHYHYQYVSLVQLSNIGEFT